MNHAGPSSPARRSDSSRGNTSNALLVGVVLACAGTLGCASPDPADRVRLIVAVSVDQLRGDLLEQYNERFTGGLRRLIDQGHVFENASLPYALTQTAPGHATLSTGVLPSRSGVVANAWVERDGDEWRNVYSAEDLDQTILGQEGSPGRSPKNLVREGLPDWMVAQDPNSKVFSVSRKDRSAIMLAGKARGDVYWLEPGAGRFVTSTYYATDYPEWVTAFNDGEMRQFYADSVWSPVWGQAAVETTRSDTATYEGDGRHSYFPHEFATEEDGEDEEAFNLWIAETPFVDAATFAFARAAVEALDLGEDESVDFLGLGLSQTDIVGHRFGPLSHEQLDNLLRLDEELGRFMSYLDERVGAGQWILGFSADHGVLTTPEYLQEIGEPGARLSSEQVDDFRGAINRVMASNPTDTAAAIAEALEALPFIEDGMPFAELASAEAPADSFVALYRASYFPGRVTGPVGTLGLEIRTEPNFLLITGPARGTSHGSPYWYDRHVPLVFIADGARPVETDAPYTVDFAPTLAALAGIEVPDDLDGRPLLSWSGTR